MTRAPRPAAQAPAAPEAAPVAGEPVRMRGTVSGLTTTTAHALAGAQIQVAFGLAVPTSPPGRYRARVSGRLAAVVAAVLRGGAAVVVEGHVMPPSSGVVPDLEVVAIEVGGVRLAEVAE